MLEFRSIVHPTDFSGASANAFAHALRIAVATKAELIILHVSTNGPITPWMFFPRVRQTLANWGMMDENDGTIALRTKVGIQVRKVEIAPQSPLRGILRFLATHPPSLIVLATEGRRGIARWLHGSVAEGLAREARTPTLFVPAKARGFVDVKRGEVRLRHVLIPVDREPRPDAAVADIMEFAHLLAGMSAEERLVHIGRDAPRVARGAGSKRPLPVESRSGDVVAKIVEAANDWMADLIGMPTAGHHGFLDALRGSTTERVLRRAPCPLLAVPAGR